MSDDPRIRGICEPCNDYNDSLIPRPSIDKCKGVPLGTSFRIGTIVRYNNEDRTVQRVNFYYDRPSCCFEAGRRIVTTLDLGPPDNNITWDLVKIVKY